MSVLILVTCGEGGESFSGFRWPLKVGAVAEPQYWDPKTVCGGGLHGLLWGCGDGAILDPGAPYWLVCEAEKYVELGGQAKGARCTVRHVGDRDGAIAFLEENGAADKPVVFSMRKAGHYGMATAGYGGTARAGYRGTAIAGDRGKATAGDYGTAAAGYGGVATAGGGGTAKAGYYGTATAGDDGKATAGDYGMATAGDGGVATAGGGGAAAAGDDGMLCIHWYDRERRQLAVAYVGENEIKPNTPYRLDDYGNFVEAGQ